MDDIPDMDDETDGFGGVEEEEDEATVPCVPPASCLLAGRHADSTRIATT